MGSCEMKGFLSFILLWLISKGPINGARITEEMEKRKGTLPSPGTIYPALKCLREKRLVTVDENKAYSLSAKGERELRRLIAAFFSTFCDLDEMRIFFGNHRRIRR